MVHSIKKKIQVVTSGSKIQFHLDTNLCAEKQWLWTRDIYTPGYTSAISMGYVKQL